jgi:hypothetical protein
MEKQLNKKSIVNPYSWQTKMDSAVAILEDMKSGSSSDDDEQDKRAKNKSAKMDDEDAPWKPSHRRHRRQQQPPPAEMDTTGDQKEKPSSFLQAVAELEQTKKQAHGKKCHADYCKLPCDPPESSFCGYEEHRFPQDSYGNRKCAIQDCRGTTFSQVEALCPLHTPREPRRAATTTTTEIKNKKQPEPEDAMAWMSNDDLEPLPQLKNVNTVDITRFKHKKTGEIYYHAAGVATVFFEPNEGRKSADARLVVRLLKDKGPGLYTHVGNSRIVYLTSRGLQVVLPLLDAKDEIVAAFAQEPMTTTQEEGEDNKNQKKRKLDGDNGDDGDKQPEKKAKTSNSDEKEEVKKEKKQVRWQCMHQAGCDQESLEGTTLCALHTPPPKPQPVEALFQDSQVQLVHIPSSPVSIPQAILSEPPRVVSAAPEVKDPFPGFISVVIPHEIKEDNFSAASGVVLMEDDDRGSHEDAEKKKEEYKPLFKPSVFGEVFRCLDETARCQTPEYKKSGRCEFHYKKLNGLPVQKKNRSGEGMHTWYPCHYERCNGSANNIASGLRYCSEAHKNRVDGLGIHYCVEQGCKEQAFKNDGKYCAKHHPNRCNYDNDCQVVLEGTGAGLCDAHLKLFQKQQEEIRAQKQKEMKMKKTPVIVIPDEDRKLTRAVEHYDPQTGKIGEIHRLESAAPLPLPQVTQNGQQPPPPLSRMQKELEMYKVRDEYLKMLGWMKNNVPRLAMAPAHATAFTVCIQNLQANVFNLSGKSL